MWYPGHIEKAKTLIKQNLKLVDAVIEVLDARALLQAEHTKKKSYLETKKESFY